MSSPRCAVIVPASGHAPGVDGFGRCLDSRSVAKFKFPEHAVPMGRLPRNDAAESEKV